jgi:hypothetical protein
MSTLNGENNKKGTANTWSPKHFVVWFGSEARHVTVTLLFFGPHHSSREGKTVWNNKLSLPTVFLKIIYLFQLESLMNTN